MCIRDRGKYAPKIDSISIDPQKIGDVVGKQGSTINKIIEETGVKIDISEEGNVSICGTDKEMIEKAKSIVKSIVTDIEPGQVCLLYTSFPSDRPEGAGSDPGRDG